MKKIWLLTFLLTIILIPLVKADYSKEQISAYTWAFNNLITTQSTIDKANMNWEITRIELSKMISNYVINVLEKKLDNSKKCQFFDITAELDKQYDNWVTKACQLWLMGQWISEFRPYDKVTRAEFWTILSRALYWEKYNWWNPYYTKHLNQLNLDWIIKNINNAETRKEIRWYVMLMMMRSQNWWWNSQSQLNPNIPNFENLGDVVSKCPYEMLWWWHDELLVTKEQYILPYKDWYIGYHYWWNWDGWSYYLTYKSLNNPCDTISYSDSFFHVYLDRISDNEDNLLFHDNKVYRSIWWGWTVLDKIEKELDCKSGDNSCKKVMDRYMYNLILWKEKNDYFSQWFERFKFDIDNNIFREFSFWHERWSECILKYPWESLLKEYWEDSKNLTDESRRKYNKILNERVYNCLSDYISKL